MPNTNDVLKVPITFQVNVKELDDGSKEAKKILKNNIKESLKELDKQAIRSMKVSKDQWQAMAKWAGNYYKLIGKFTSKGAPAVSGLKIKRIDSGKVAEEYSNMGQSQQKYTNDLYKERGRQFAKLMGVSDDEIRLGELKATLNELEEKFRNIEDSGSEAFKETSEEIAKTKKEIDELNKKLNDTGKKTGGSGIGKSVSRLVNTFKRIGFYRIARNVFRIIENGFKSGINNLIQFDKSANQTMSSLSTSLTRLMDSFTLMLMPAMEILEPIMKSISSEIAGIAEKISMASASMKGMTSYTKLNDKYMKDLAEQANSATLSFDKFETLGGSTEKRYTTEEMTPEQQKEAEENAEKLQKIRNAIARIVDILKTLWRLVKDIWAIIEPIINPLLDTIEIIINAIREVVNTLGGDLRPILLIVLGIITAISLGVFFLTTIPGMITAIVMAIIAVVYVVKKYGKEIGEFFKNIGKAVVNFFIGIANIFISIFENIVNFIINAVNALLTPVRGVLGIFGVHWDGIHQQHFNRITYLANGGMVDSGSLFVAGESGAELVTTMPSGQTGVTNIAQFRQAMVEALYEWSEGQASGTGNNIILNIDGAEIARSKRFKAELNRTNTGLNLR